ncbi:NUDIX hydrolase [Halarcobacter mediterraneus]|uniref:NUDIX hydrolase n=1 Tax=Halarcobacter mediterraneus TaxID=2023153 RepID=A0A4Q1AXA9_9BACT|nr:NUDIX hydrolase [Halarcobacter mediterraneus]RXK13953.1 NUDIX hydrolase [Halarcobacter mediterraneus]
MNNKIEEFKTQKLENPKFVYPLRINYIQNGKRKTWEVVKNFDSVAILLYHEEKKSFLLVKQFRPAVYLNDDSKKCTYELCAGIVDKELSLAQIAKEEIDEECGFDVPLSSIEKITSFYTNVGVSGGCQHLYFAKIDESMKIHEGGGIHDEQIELMYLPIEQYKEFIFDESKAKTPGLMFAFMWYMEKLIKN